MRLDELARRIGATLHGDPSVEVHSCAPVDRASHGQVSFVANSKYIDHLLRTGASAVIVAPELSVREGVDYAGVGPGRFFVRPPLSQCVAPTMPL